MKKVLFYTNQFFGQIGGEAEQEEMHRRLFRFSKMPRLWKRSCAETTIMPRIWMR